MGVTLADIAGAVEEFAPPELAESWDRTGLQVGDPRATVEKVLLALDASPTAIAEAAAQGAQLLLTHHPLFLSPLEQLDLSLPPAHLVARLIRDGTALYVAHTNLDKADGGVNDRLASILGLEAIEPLGPGETQVKIVVTVPLGYEGPVRRALAAEGAGRIGRYTGCTFGCRGEGTFTPTVGTSLLEGSAGGEERFEETRIEVVVPRSRLGAVRAALARARPHESPPVDIYPLENRATQGGLGRVGQLHRPARLSEWASEVARVLEAPCARLVGDPEMTVERVAVCGGSGESLWQVAKARGAQVLVTGDAKYHTASSARDEGFAILDVGHGPSERCALEVLRGVLERWAGGRGVELSVRRYVEADPFCTVRTVAD